MSSFSSSNRRTNKIFQKYIIIDLQICRNNDGANDSKDVGSVHPDQGQGRAQAALPQRPL